MLQEHSGRTNEACPVPSHDDQTRRIVLDAFTRISKKWRLHVLWAVAERPQRFNELLKTDGNLSSFMLAQTLRELERDGLVHRQIVPSRPPCTAYQISGDGTELLASLQPLLNWANRDRPKPGSLEA